MTRWWRAYSAARHDPKVQRLNGEMFKAWFNLLCLAADHDGTLPPLADVAFELRKTEGVTRGLLADLVARGLLDESLNGISPHNWNVRQYKSDVSTERVKRFRERSSNVSETPSENREQNTDTESKKDHSTRKPSADAKRGSRLAEDWQPSEADRAFASDLGVDAQQTADEFRDYWTSLPGVRACKLDWSKTFRNRCRELGKKPKVNGVSGRKPWEKAPVDLPAASPWEKRIADFVKDGFWMPQMWGPKPTEPGCHAPKELLGGIGREQ